MRQSPVGPLTVPLQMLPPHAAPTVSVRCRRDDRLREGTSNVQYRLVIENFKSEKVPVRLFDRLPYSDRKTDFRVTLTELEDKLSDDKLYLRVERPKGILRWEIDVPVRATGENAHIVKFGYKVEFDRNFQLVTPGAARAGDENQPMPAEAAQPKAEFDEMQRIRAAH